MQCVQQLCSDTGKPIQQLAISSSSNLSTSAANLSTTTASGEQLLLAARGPHQIAIMQTSSTQYDDR